MIDQETINAFNHIGTTYKCKDELPKMLHKIEDKLISSLSDSEQLEFYEVVFALSRGTLTIKQFEAFRKNPLAHKLWRRLLNLLKTEGEIQYVHGKS